MPARDSEGSFTGEEPLWGGTGVGLGGVFSSPMMGPATPMESPQSSKSTRDSEFPDEKIGFRRFVKGAASGVATGVAGVAGSWFGAKEGDARTS